MNSQRQLLDTIESLENRIEKHTEVIHGLKQIIKTYKDHGQANKELADITKYLESLIEGAYK
jgi:hypothetical protein